MAHLPNYIKDSHKITITNGTNRTSSNLQIFVMKHTKWHTFKKNVKESNKMINQYGDKLIIITLAQTTVFSGACTCTCVCACTITNGTNRRSSNVQISVMKRTKWHIFQK